MQVVTLSLGNEVFAIPVGYVREILEYRAPFSLPDVPPWFCGLIDVRGRGTPVIDLRAKLGLPRVPPGDTTRILVLDVAVGDKLLALGLVADRVLEVINITADQIEAAPDVGIPWRSDYIAGVVRRDSGFVVIFHLENLITTADSATLNESLARAA